MAFTRAADAGDLDEGALIAVQVGGVPVCLARVGGVVYAFADICSHRDFPLSEGEIDPADCSVTCDWHGARFDIRDGRPLSPPATRPVRVFECRVDGDGIYVDVG